MSKVTAKFPSSISKVDGSLCRAFGPMRMAERAIALSRNPRWCSRSAVVGPMKRRAKSA